MKKNKEENLSEKELNKEKLINDKKQKIKPSKKNIKMIQSIKLKFN